MELEAHGLACRRGGRLLFDDLSFAAPPGSLVGVRGPNGAGKSSLLRLLAGLGLPEAGTVTWDGRPITADRDTFNAELAWLSHADGLKGELTPRENLVFHHALCRRDGRRAPAAGAVADALTQFGLGAVADRPCRQLSAGQRRRAALARLSVAAATIWILDEPMAALDVEGQHVIDTMIAAHCAGGGIAIVTSHQAFAVAHPTVEVAIK